LCYRCGALLHRVLLLLLSPLSRSKRSGWCCPRLLAPPAGSASSSPAPSACPCRLFARSICLCRPPDSESRPPYKSRSPSRSIPAPRV
jgi:hypothetical protein